MNVEWTVEPLPGSLLTGAPPSALASPFSALEIVCSLFWKNLSTCGTRVVGHQRGEARVGGVALDPVDAVEQLRLEDVVGVDDVPELEQHAERLDDLFNQLAQLDEEAANRGGRSARCR